MTALFSPSIPIEIAPLRFTFAFSMSKTFKFGFSCFALIAAIGPAVPPPITTISNSRYLVSIEYSLFLFELLTMNT